MKRIFIIYLIVSAFNLQSQEITKQHEVDFELGSGVSFLYNEGAYGFNLGGMIQPTFGLDKREEVAFDYYFNAKRTYFHISGNAVKERVSFMIRTDFSLGQPMLDAWMAYEPIPAITITAGQKQTIANNREMMLMEDQLQFSDRSLLSNSFSDTGREFGLFIDATFGPEKFRIKPSIAVTSGDGRNSFGADSRDIDLGGLKYAARIDVYPFGLFSAGNNDRVMDLFHENSFKLVMGVAASYNDGASQSKGEGHGDFFIYNGVGDQQLPDYRQLYGDLLVKFKGFSLLGEYVIATATSLEATYTDGSGQNALVPTEISEYLSLGRGFNVQLGYAIKQGFGIDLRYSGVNPEFSFNPNSIIKETSAMSLGLTKYFKENNLKLQASISRLINEGDQNIIYGDLIFQLRI